MGRIPKISFGFSVVKAKKLIEKSYLGDIKKATSLYVISERKVVLGTSTGIIVAEKTEGGAWQLKKERYQVVIERLIDVRDAQIAHKEVTGKYSNNWRLPY